MTLRDWLRKMIGWEEMQERIELSDYRLAVTITRIDDEVAEQRKRIELIAYKRDLKPVPDFNIDWEAEQVAFMNNPDNFKEVN